MLLKVRSAIETFYGKLDELTTSMEETIAAKSTSVASELIREDVHLKPALDGYNEMVGTFYELHGTDMDIYGHSMAEKIPSKKEIFTICAKKSIVNVTCWISMDNTYIHRDQDQEIRTLIAPIGRMGF